MRFEPDWLRGAAPLLAAIVLSAGAHGAVVLIAGTRAPVDASTATPGAFDREGTASLRLHIGALAPPRPAPPPTVASAVSGAAPIGPRLAAVRATRGAPVETTTTVPQPDATLPDGSDERVERPVPLTYPVISLPPDDDPHRVGLVRLMLVVSSDGSVVRSFVTGSSLSEDYVDRIQRSFEEMRFRPAVAHGMPRAGWYEVAVNLEFDPAAPSTR